MDVQLAAAIALWGVTVETPTDPDGLETSQPSYFIGTGI